MARDEVVSNDTEALILVDEHDREIGSRAKSICHSGKGILHRAFSIFVFNGDNELLLQKRSAEKLLWPNYWSNTCCSHPRRGESMEQAASTAFVAGARLRVPARVSLQVQVSSRIRRNRRRARILLGLLRAL